MDETVLRVQMNDIILSYLSQETPITLQGLLEIKDTHCPRVLQ